MMPPGAPGFMGLMPAYASDDQDGGFALKAICLMPGNPARGLDAHQGIVTLFDGDTGIPTAILNASAVTEIRTAAVTAVATRRLAREDSTVLTILGSGVQARAHLRSLRDVRDWAQVRLFSPTAAHLRTLVDDPPVALPITAAASARDAVEGADVVVTATSSKEPVLEHAWLSDTAHVNAVGASSLTARELELETVAAAALFCDSRESVRNEALEFRLAVDEGVIAGEGHIRAELGEVLSGAADGRTPTDGLTLFRSLGIGVEDLAAATLAVRTARGTRSRDAGGAMTDLAAIEQARTRIADIAVRTPLVRLRLDELPAGTEVHCKLETLQPINSFKIRGAANAIRSASPEQRAGGLLTASAGNMAQGVAWVARELGLPATIAVPEHAPETKLAAIERLGGKVVKLPYDDWWQAIVTGRIKGLDGMFVHPVADERGDRRQRHDRAGDPRGSARRRHGRDPGRRRRAGDRHRHRDQGAAAAGEDRHR